MMRRALLLASIVSMTLAPSAPATASDAEFRRAFGDDFFDRYWELLAGLGRRVRLLQIRRPADRARRASARDRARATRPVVGRAARIDPTDLSPAVRADRAMLEAQLRGERWSLTELKSWQWDPSTYNVADTFALLLDLDYAPLEQRLRTF